MSVGKHDRTDYRTGGRVKTIAAATSLTPVDTVCDIITNGTYVVTLPPAAECAGKIFSFFHSGATGSALEVTITPHGHGVGAAGDDKYFADVSGNEVVLNAIGEKAVLYCDGRGWFMLAGQTS